MTTEGATFLTFHSILVLVVFGVVVSLLFLLNLFSFTGQAASGGASTENHTRAIIYFMIIYLNCNGLSDQILLGYLFVFAQ